MMVSVLVAILSAGLFSKFWQTFGFPQKISKHSFPVADDVNKEDVSLI